MRNMKVKLKEGNEGAKDGRKDGKRKSRKGVVKERNTKLIAL